MGHAALQSFRNNFRLIGQMPTTAPSPANPTIGHRHLPCFGRLVNLASRPSGCSPTAKNLHPLHRPLLHLQARRFPRWKPKSDRSRSESTSLLSEVGWVRAGQCVIWHCENGGSVRSHRHRAQSPCGSTPETASAPVRKNPARPFPRNYRSA